jgi:hypothetical protein
LDTHQQRMFIEKPLCYVVALNDPRDAATPRVALSDSNTEQARKFLTRVHGEPTTVTDIPPTRYLAGIERSAIRS